MGGVGYGGGWAAMKLNRSAKHLPLALCHFALVYTAKLPQEKSSSSGVPGEWLYLAVVLDQPFHVAINCVGVGHVVHARYMWDLKVLESSLPEACHLILKPVCCHHLQLAQERNHSPGKFHFGQLGLKTLQQSWSE